MILDEESEKSLRRFLIKTLQPICDADPPVLANYVIALLRNDKSRQELQDSCIQELEDFLKDETKPFVSKLFDVLKEMENKQLVHLSPAAAHSSDRNDRDYNERDDEDRDHKHARRESPPDGETGGKKRSFGEEEFKRKQNGHSEEGGPPPSSSSRRRREEEHSMSDDERRQRHSSGSSTSRDDKYATRGGMRRYGEFDNRDRPYFDPMGRGGRPDRGGRYGNGGNPPFRPRQRQRCRDYDERGYCMRGELCTFDHGADRILVSDMQDVYNLKMGEPSGPPVSLPSTVTSLPPTAPFVVNPSVDVYVPQQKRPKFDKERRYDPTDMAPYNPESPMFSMNASAANWNPSTFGMGRNRAPRFTKPVGVPEDSVALNPTNPFGYNNGNSNNNNNNNNSIVLPSHNFPPQEKDVRVVVEVPSKAPSSAVELGPTEDKRPKGFNPNYNSGFNPNFKSQTTLLITNIPPDLNSIDKLNSHFKKFGTVVNLQVKFAANKAFVQFINHAEALRALRSVDAVLGNRFIKVHWAHRPEDNQQQQGHQTSPPKPDALQAKPKSETPEFKPTPTPAPTPAPATTPAFVPTAPSTPIKELQERRLQQIEESKKLLDMMGKKLRTVGPKEQEELLKSMKATTKTLEELLKKDATSIQQMKQQATAKAAPTVVSPKLSKAQKEKERLDRELDQISAPSSTRQTPLTSSTSSLSSSTSSVPSPPQTPTTAATGPSSLSHLQLLKNSLEQTALSMGLDTSSVRGRARGGRGGRGQRGRGRGSSAGRGRGGAGMTLDNRSTTLIVGNLPLELKNEDALRAHFQTFGDIGSVSLHEDKALVQFSGRRFAEAAFTQGRQFKTHNLNINWHDNLKSVPANVVGLVTKDEVEAVVDTSEETKQQYYEEEEDDDEGVERSWKHKIT